MQQEALQRIENILNRLSIKWEQRSPQRINILCPVHNSTDLSSSCIYLTNGNYQCWSRGCNTSIGNNFLNLIRWSLSQNKEWQVNWEDVKAFIANEEVVSDRKIQDHIEEDIFYIDPAKYPPVSTPSKYYIDRGFTPEVLNRYGVGDCKTFPYHDRAIVPVNCPGGKLMGFSGRSHHEKCAKCEYYHSKYNICIKDDDEYKQFYSKWFHSSKMKKTKTLYGIDKCDLSHGKIVLVEGPSCVWRLSEFMIPAAAVLGRTFNRSQADILKRNRVTKIFLISDEDVPGQEFKAKFIEEWYTEFEITVTKLPKKDVSEMTDEEIEKHIIERWYNI